MRLGGRWVSQLSGRNTMDNHTILHAKDVAQERYLSQPGIVGMGVGYKTTEGESTDELGVVMLVEEKLPLAALSHETALPPVIHNVPLDVVQVGKIRVAPPAVTQLDRTDKWRPAPPGVSIGHYKITAGTFGAAVREKVTGNLLMLSNNHVVANSNDAKLEDMILQPGPYDGGTAGDVIGRLHRFVEIDFGQMGNGDCPLAESYVAVGNALARLFRSSHIVKSLRVNPQAVNVVDAGLVKPDTVADIDPNILEIGVPSGTTEAELGMTVMKSGRTTGLTTGKVNLINVTVTVDYGGGRSATFENQVATGPMSQGGDSGSLLVTEDNGLLAVGLLYAGSNQATIFNPIKEVFTALMVEI